MLATVRSIDTLLCVFLSEVRLFVCLSVSIKIILRPTAFFKAFLCCHFRIELSSTSLFSVRWLFISCFDNSSYLVV